MAKSFFPLFALLMYIDIIAGIYLLYRVAPQAHRRPAGAAPGLGAQEVPGDARAARAARGRAPARLPARQLVPGPLLPLPPRHGLEHRLPVPQGAERDRQLPPPSPAHHPRRQCPHSGR